LLFANGNALEATDGSFSGNITAAGSGSFSGNAFQIGDDAGGSTLRIIQNDPSAQSLKIGTNSVADTVVLKSDGSITAAGSVESSVSTFDPTNPNSVGCQLSPGGAITVKRASDIGSTASLYLGYTGTDNVFEVTADGSITTDGSITSVGRIRTGADTFTGAGCAIAPAGNIYLQAASNDNSIAFAIVNNSDYGNPVASISHNGNITAASDIISGVRDQDGSFMTPSGAAEGWNGGSKVWSLGSAGSIIARSLTIVNGSDNLVDLLSTGQNIFYRPTNSPGAAVISSLSDVNGTQSGIFELKANGQLSARKTSIDAIGSERRIKENIELIDPVSAWKTIKSTPYYSYNYIGTDPSDVSYGPIVDEVPAEMVVQPMEENEVGVMVARSDEEGPIRTFDNGMLQARLYTALQSALTRIEALEAELKTLKGASK